MKFSYKRYGATTERPVIPIKLKHGDTSIGYEVLVDSGADLCIFDAEIGEALGLDMKKGRPREVFGVGGKASVYYLHKVEIEVGGWTYNHKREESENSFSFSLSAVVIYSKTFANLWFLSI
jgi:hypothetical protein